MSISGRLTTADMGRFEHACSRALTRHPANLELDLRRVTYVDATAVAVIRRMAERGARVSGMLHVVEGSQEQHGHR